MDIISSLNAINDLTGGYARGIPTGLSAEPQGGKSTLLGQESFFFAKHFGTIHVDTEGAIMQMYREWKPIFEKRFNVQANLMELTADPKSKTFKPKLTKSNDEGMPIIVANLRSIKRMLQFFGLESDVEASDKGKYGFRFKGFTKEAYIRTLLDEHNIECVIIDSLTNPLNIFAGGLVNYPARADAAKVFFTECQRLSDDYMPLFLMTHHTSKDPQNQYAEPSTVGGKIIRHNTKISFYMEKSRSTANRYKNRRWLYLDRWFSKPRFSEKRKIELTDIGFVDVEDTQEDE